MPLPELALRATIWLSLLAWVVGEWRRSSSQGARGRWAWTAGAMAAAAHSALAFDLRYAWSHAAAYVDTARQTGAATGLAWGGGIFFNYVFLAVWAADAVWWGLSPGSFLRRGRGLDRAVRGFLWFMFLNGTVVFGHGPIRWLGAAAVIAVAVGWYRRA